MLYSALLFGIASISAQNPQPANTAAPKASIQLVKTGLYMISGGGKNALLRLSGNGLILVDGNVPGDFTLQAQLKAISSQPVRFLILTGDRGSLAGNAAKAVEAGARIVANANLKLDPLDRNAAGVTASAPTIAYDREYTLHLGGVEAQVRHLGNARTNADAVVYFPNLKVIAVGDLFASSPDPDFSRGGSLVGWGQVLTAILKLDFDVVIPRSGPPLKRADLESFQQKIDSLIARATGLVRKGVPKDRLMAKLQAEDRGWPNPRATGWTVSTLSWKRPALRQTHVHNASPERTRTIVQPVITEQQLREKLRKITALFEGAATPGERQAAAAAMDRLREALRATAKTQPLPETRFSMADQWQRRLFTALCRRYGLEPFRYKGQHKTTVMLRAPRFFIDNTLWPEFCGLQGALHAYLNEATERIIREEVFGDTAEAAERAG